MDEIFKPFLSDSISPAPKLQCWCNMRCFSFNGQKKSKGCIFPLFFVSFLLVRVCVLSLFPSFPQVFRVLFIIFRRLYRLFTGIRFISQVFVAFYLAVLISDWLSSIFRRLFFLDFVLGQSMVFIDASRSFTASFLGCCYLLLSSMVCGHWSYSCVICLHSLGPFFLCFFGHQNGFRSTKNAWRLRLQKSCCQIKCMDIVFKDVILLQNGVIHCKLYCGSR